MSAILRRPSVGALAEANRAHLGQRADGLRQALADGENAGDEGRADGAEADEQNAEFALCWRNLNGFHSGVELYHSAMAAIPARPAAGTAHRLHHRRPHRPPHRRRDRQRSAACSSTMAAKVGITGGAYALTTDAAAVSRVQAAARRARRAGGRGPDRVAAAAAGRRPSTSPWSTTVSRAPERTAHRPPCSRTLRRVLRPGGRIILAVPAPSSALAGLFGITPKPPDVQPLLDLLRDAGFIAARLLAAREGVGYVEAARPM